MARPRFEVPATLLALAGALLLASCAAGGALRFRSEVDALAAPDAQAKTSYVLLPGDDKTNAGDLQFQEFSRYVDRVLMDRGFTKAANPKEADIAIFFTYAIGDPQEHQFTYTVPKYGQTGISSSTTFGTIQTYGNNATYSATTEYTPTYEVVGSETRQISVTTSTRFLRLTAIDLAAFKKDSSTMRQVWTTTVVSTGSSDDLRLVMPYMIQAARPYLAGNTGKKIKVTVSGSDAGVKELRGIAPVAR